jgi:hypothetical protein
MQTVFNSRVTADELEKVACRLGCAADEVFCFSGSFVAYISLTRYPDDIVKSHPIYSLIIKTQISSDKHC